MPPRRVVRRPLAPVGPSPDALAPDCSLTVGIDPSLTGYGIVLWWPDRSAHSDVLIKTNSKHTYARRLTEIRETVASLLRPEKEHISLICMERPAYDASGAFTGGLVHAATAFALTDVFGLENNHVAPVLVANNTLKKFVTGKGVGQKGLMVKYVYQKWGYDTNDDNLADAYGLARLAAAVLCRTSEHQYERDCIDTVRRSMSWEPLPPPSNPQSTSKPPSRTRAARVGSTSSRSTGRRKSSSASATPATSSNSRAASRSLSRTAARSPSGG